MMHVYIHKNIRKMKWMNIYCSTLLVLDVMNNIHKIKQKLLFINTNTKFIKKFK